MCYLECLLSLVLYVMTHECRFSVICFFFFFVQAEDGIRDLGRSRGLGDVYKRQVRMKDRSEGGRVDIAVMKARKIKICCDSGQEHFLSLIHI
mgnify:CR=1 FL=1